MTPRRFFPLARQLSLCASILFFASLPLPGEECWVSFDLELCRLTQLGFCNGRAGTECWVEVTASQLEVPPPSPSDFDELGPDLRVDGFSHSRTKNGKIVYCFGDLEKLVSSGATYTLHTARQDDVLIEVIHHRDPSGPGECPSVVPFVVNTAYAGAIHLERQREKTAVRQGVAFAIDCSLTDVNVAYANAHEQGGAPNGAPVMFNIGLSTAGPIAALSIPFSPGPFVPGASTAYLEKFGMNPNDQALGNFETVSVYTRVEDYHWYDNPHPGATKSRLELLTEFCRVRFICENICVEADIDRIIDSLYTAF